MLAVKEEETVAAERRRHRGEGSIYQRESDGRWVGVVDLGLVGGKRVRKTVTAATLRELKPRFAKLKEQVQSGILTDDATVAEWMDHWLTHVAAERIRPSTMRNYRAQTENWVKPHIGHLRLDRVRPDHLRVLYSTMKEQGRSDNTRHHVHAMLRRAFRVAERDGRLAFNPAERVDAPPVGKFTHGKLTLPEAKAVLGQLEGRADAARWAVALLAGVRQGEALGLRWEDVDLDAGVIRVRRAAQRIKGQGVVTVPLKSDSAERDVPMVPPVHYALTELAARVDPTGFVFGRPDRPADPKEDWKVWKALLEAAGVDHKPLHAARATTASLLDEAGVSPKIIAEIMGHAQVTTTQRHYISGDSRVHREAMGRLDALISRA